MHAFCSAVFWLAFFFVVYTYAIYPVVIALLARLVASPVRRDENFQPRISVVVAAFNEAANLPARVANLLAQDYPPEKYEIILVDDGSGDESANVMRELAARNSERVKIIAMPVNAGKAVALNAGVELASN